MADTPPIILHHCEKSPFSEKIRVVFGIKKIIVSLSTQHIAIRRKDERAGEIIVHFPRAGFLVVPAG